MMYILSGGKTNVKIIFKYNSSKLLERFEAEGDITEEQLKYIFWNENFSFPYQENLIKNVIKMGHFIVKKVEEDLSFERFWKEYGIKVSKKKAEKLWEKISKANRIRVFEHIPRYKAYLSRKGIEHAYPDTYLRNEKWEDEY